MTDELYINGVRADMSEDSGVYLDFESGILSSLDTVSANHSYSIKLPVTATNRRIIDGLFTPTSDSTFPMVQNVATLYRDGVAIVEGAALSLLEVDDDTIEVCLSWGVDDLLSAVDGMDIADLYSSGETYTWVESRCPIGEYGAARGAGEYQHMTLAVSEVLSRINALCGGRLSYGDVSRYVFPLLLRVRAAGSTIGDAELSVGALTYNNSGQYEGYHFLFTGTIIADGDVSLSPTIGGVGPLGFITPYDVSYMVTIDIQMGYEGTGVAPSLYFGLGNIDGGGYVPHDVELRPERMYDAAGRTVYRYAATEVIIKSHIIDPSAGEYYYGFATAGTGYASKMYFYGDDAVPHITVAKYTEDETDDDEAVPGDTLAYVDNMPDISCKDFIKGVCGVLGWYVQTVGDAVFLVSYADILSHTYGVYDWSGKVLHATDVPRAMALSPDGVARDNRFLFANSDDIATWGVVRIDNYALDEATDYMSLAVCGTTADGTIANIPIYTLAIDEETGQQVWEYDEDTGCYLVELMNGYLYRLPIATEYIGRLMAGRVITEYVALDVLDLRDIDMRKVVYLSQYGCYFAIVSIKTKSAYSEVQLLTVE